MNKLIRSFQQPHALEQLNNITAFKDYLNLFFVNLPPLSNTQQTREFVLMALTPDGPFAILSILLYFFPMNVNVAMDFAAIMLIQKPQQQAPGNFFFPDDTFLIDPSSGSLQPTTFFNKHQPEAFNQRIQLFEKYALLYSA